MRVLHCIASFSGGGAEARLATLCEAAERHPDILFHVAYVRGGPNLKRVENTGTRLHPLHARGNYDPRLVREIATVIRENKINMVQTWMPMMDVFGGAAAHLAGRPHVLSECSAGALYPATWKNWLRRLLGRKASAIVANSEEGLRYWRGLVPEDKLHLIGNPLDLERLTATAAIDDGRFQEVAKGKKLLLYAGRFTEAKNLPCLCDALDRLLRVRTDVNVAFFGIGEKLEELTTRLRKWTPERVRFMGFSDELPSWLKRADAIVSLSKVEGLPNIVLESAVLRVPQVLSDIPQHRAAVGDEGAFFCSPASPDDVCAQLQSALDDVQSGDRKVAAAYERVAQYDMQKIINAYAQLYRTLSAEP
jgi:glycosyltransferase involved in cell wall biosynthesis